MSVANFEIVHESIGTILQRWSQFFIRKYCNIMLGPLTDPDSLVRSKCKCKRYPKEGWPVGHWSMQRETLINTNWQADNQVRLVSCVSAGWWTIITRSESCQMFWVRQFTRVMNVALEDSRKIWQIARWTNVSLFCSSKYSHGEWNWWPCRSRWWC